MIDCNEWKTEICHECANMGKVKRLELWWQLHRTSLSVRDLENFRPMDFCSTECTYWLQWTCVCCRTVQRDHLWLSEHVLTEHLRSVWEQSVSILSNLQPGLCPASSCDSDPDNLFRHGPAALPLGLPVTRMDGIVWLPHESSVGNVVVQLGILMRGSKESWGNLYKPIY